ncbi:MAG: MATE family efflux transporter [Odoribacteraceae bacterium]|jgi:putative MATE family efflux protein|nr:MATE family efflux transporter [Odoribacteraceae bacterium]
MKKMSEINDLTRGGVGKSVWSMAIPLITASFIQMAYSLTDMFWVGRLGSESVAAVGAAAFFLWLCNSLSMICKVGVEVAVSQSLGARQPLRARVYANQAALLASILAFLYAAFIWLMADHLISLFHLETSISGRSATYLRTTVPGLFFLFHNNVFSGIYNGQGNSKTPFKILSAGFICNIIFDPLFIYGAGVIPPLGVTGAALATVLSQCVVFVIFAYNLYYKRSPLGKLRLVGRLRRRFTARVATLGFPVSLQNGLFALFSLALATLAARWGHVGLAVQSIGAQVEALTWMTAAGFSTALAAFVGQNFGARDFERIRRGYRYTLKLAGSVSLVATIAFFFFGRPIFSLFVREPGTVEAGNDYLRILALSQIFSAFESVTAGAFNGLGRTIPPAITGIFLTGARVPLAYYLITLPFLGLNGVWWSITLSSILKGAVLMTWYRYFQRKKLPRAPRQSRPGKIIS